MTGIVVLVKDGYGQIRGESGLLYDFGRSDGDNGALRPADRVTFEPVTRFSRWRAHNVTAIPSTSTTTTTSKGAATT